MSGNKKENLFAKLAQQNARAETASPADATAAVDSSPETGLPPSPAPPAETPKARPAATRKKVEPVAGKRNNPDYCQANAYLPKALRREVERALLDIEGMDYSSLVEDLLRKWLRVKGISA